MMRDWEEADMCHAFMQDMVNSICLKRNNEIDSIMYEPWGGQFVKKPEPIAFIQDIGHC